MNTQNRLIRFPQPVKIGIRAVAFVENEIDEWIVVAIEKRKPLRKRKEIQ